jgi:amidase
MRLAKSERDLGSMAGGKGMSTSVKFDNFLDATAQAALVKNGKLSASELVEETIRVIDKVNPSINSVIIPLYEKARREAKAVTASAPFAGVPYVLKDLTIVSKGDLNTSSISGVKKAGYKSDHDSYFVERMRDAGFVLIGRANTPEMGTEATTEPEAWGQTRNPWNRDMSVGGSSGGSAAAVGAGLVPVAHGNDAGGSVRSPASLNGIVGLKPTRGRISTGPMVTDSDCVGGLAHEGIFSRSVRDIAALLDVVSGHRPGDAYYAPPPIRPFSKEVGVDPGSLRIGVLTADPAGEFTLDPECAAAARSAADTLANLGHKVSNSHPEALKSRKWLAEFMSCSDVAILREIERYSALIGRDLTENDMEWGTWQFVLRGREVTGKTYAAGIDALRVHAGELEKWWENDGWDLLVTPTVGRQHPKLGELKTKRGNPFVEGSLPMLAMTVPYNVSGQPAISLPLAMSKACMPIGVQLIAAYGREDVLFRVAAQLEKALPWASRRPPLQ